MKVSNILSYCIITFLFFIFIYFKLKSSDTRLNIELKAFHLSRNDRLNREFPTKMASPCWCSALIKYVDESTKLLEDRYNETILKASYVYTTSGKLNKLERRLLKSLNQNNNNNDPFPFRIGVIGGSYSLQNSFSGNSWSFNITRFLNKILSVGTCRPESVLPLQDINATCRNTTNVSNIQFYKGCNIGSKYTLSGSVFCSSFPNNSSKEASYHVSGFLPLEYICDNTVSPIRDCSIFRGSGEYATLVLGGKGGSTSSDGIWAINNLGEDPLDLIIWDFGMNDMSSLLFHKNFLQGIFERSVEVYPDLSALAAVYWNDKSGEFASSCKEKGRVKWTSDLSVIDYPYLKHKFNERYGKYRNLSFISMSLPGYCRSAGCSPSDVLGAHTGHPSDTGTAFFADLFIYQLLAFFRKIIARECTHHKNSGYNNSNSNHDQLGKEEKDSLESSWTLENNLENVQLFHKESIHFVKTEIPKFINNSFYSWSLSALFSSHSPTITSPPPVNTFALLCAPSSSNITTRNVFDVTAELPSNTELHWVSADIVSVMKRRCAGWNQDAVREMHRTDSQHKFIPTATIECPSGSIEGKYCSEPNWSNSTGYPHHTWPQIPVVKAVDIVFRFSISFQWKFSCFNFKCLPLILYIDNNGSWKSQPTSKIKEEYIPLNKFCVQKISKHPPKFHGFYYYLWFRADTCYPWYMNQQSNPGKWTGVELSSYFYFINETRTHWT